MIIIFWMICLILFITLPQFTRVWRGQRTLNILIWTGIVSSKVIADFERKTGINVNIMYFDNNEELFVKLYTSGGKGYDVIMPSDYLIPKLINHGLIKPLDKRRCTFWPRLDSRLLNRYFDPHNAFTAPYYWGIYGIGINKKVVSYPLEQLSWRLLFNSHVQEPNIGMINVAREAILIAGLFLFKKVRDFSSGQIKLIKETLIQQKSKVVAYIDADVRSNYMLISKNAAVSIASTPYIQKIMPKYSHIQFLVPQEGTFNVIDSFAISVASTNDDIIYRLLNYLYEPEVLEYQFQEEPFFPATIELKYLMDKYHVPKSIQDVHLNGAVPLYFFKEILPEVQVNDIWISIKTA